MIAEAQRIAPISSDLYWVDWERYCARQETRLLRGGVLGKVMYGDNLQEFLPLLRLGEYIHRPAALQADVCRVEPHPAGHPAPHQLPVVGVFHLHLADLSGQEMLQRAAGLLDPTAPMPRPAQVRRREVCLLTQPVEARFACVIDQDQRDPFIGGTRLWASGIAGPWHLQAVPPGPGRLGHKHLPSTTKVPCWCVWICAGNAESPNPRSATLNGIGSRRRRGRTVQVRTRITCRQVNGSPQGRPGPGGQVGG